MKAVRLVRLEKPLEDAEVVTSKISGLRSPGSSRSLRDLSLRRALSRWHFAHRILAVDPRTRSSGACGSRRRRSHHVSPHDRVYVHYLVSCGRCDFCLRGHEQFCVQGQMIGKHRDGGYAEFIKVPGRNVMLLPDEIPFEHGAIMMCSSATALHALNKARLQSR